MQDLVKEFLDSNDEGEAAKCWRDLDVSFYGHQLVYAVLLAAFEFPAKSDQLMQLLNRFADSGEVSQARIAFRQLKRVSAQAKFAVLACPCGM